MTADLDELAAFLTHGVDRDRSSIRAEAPSEESCAASKVATSILNSRRRWVLAN